MTVTRANVGSNVNVSRSRAVVVLVAIATVSGNVHVTRPLKRAFFIIGAWGVV